MRTSARWLLDCAALGALAWLVVVVAGVRLRRAPSSRPAPTPLFAAPGTAANAAVVAPRRPPTLAVLLARGADF